MDYLEYAYIQTLAALPIPPWPQAGLGMSGSASFRRMKKSW